MSLNDLPGEKGLGLSVQTYVAIIHYSLGQRPNEACGLLYRDLTLPGGLRLWRFAAVPNVASDPRRAFLLQPEAQRDMMERFEVGGLVHSHPNGEARPSDFDLTSWVEEGWWYLVVGMMTGVPLLGCSQIVGGKFVRKPVSVI